MESSEYEALVKRLVERLSDNAEGLQDIEVRGGPRNRIRGASGFEHQIDVSVHSADTLFIAECKLWQDPVDVEPVLVLESRISDIGAAVPATRVHGSIVSTQSVTQGASTLAGYFGISVDRVADESEYCVRILNYVFLTGKSTVSFTDEVKCWVNGKP